MFRERSTGFRRDACAFGLLLVVRVVASLSVNRAGLRALSDDDYARAVIAERFASSASLDPSGTSWLPFPFWFTGSAMKVFGPSLDVARAAGLFAAVLATMLVYAGARVFGLRPRRAFLAAAFSVVVPPALVLGAVPTPELLASALAAFALLATARENGPVEWAGGALFFATLSRYETWPIAAVVAIACGVRAARSRSAAERTRLGFAAGLSLLGPVLWVLHGRLSHGTWFDAFTRVAAYRHALVGAPSASSDALAYVFALFIGCPTVSLPLVVAAVVVAQSGASGRAALFRWLVPALGAASLFVFLELGAWLGGTPTHHAERTLLAVWLLAAVAVLDLTSRTMQRVGIEAAVRVAMVAATLPPLWALDRGSLPWAALGIDRRDEEAAGSALARLGVGSDRALISTPDYGYFAVMAASGRPEATTADATHDPRTEPPERGVPETAEASFCDRLAAAKARWLVASWASMPARSGAAEDRLPSAFVEVARAGKMAVYDASCDKSAR